MAKVDDVAAAIVTRLKPVDTFKLQKLVYYSQAWHLVWESKPLFRAPIEAWANGPVCPALYRQHRGRFAVATWEGSPEALKDNEAETVEAIIGSYGKLTGRQLSTLTHQEAPWIEARRGLRPGERGNRVIEQDAMAEFYGAVDAEETAIDVAEYAAELGSN